MGGGGHPAWVRLDGGLVGGPAGQLGGLLIGQVWGLGIMHFWQAILPFPCQLPSHTGCPPKQLVTHKHSVPCLCELALHLTSYAPLRPSPKGCAVRIIKAMVPLTWGSDLGLGMLCPGPLLSAGTPMPLLPLAAPSSLCPQASSRPSPRAEWC